MTVNSLTNSRPLPDDVVLRVEHLSKKFCRTLKRSMYYGSIDIARSMMGIHYDTGKLRPAEFWALDDVSFELKRGETLGLIGQNGCGKTTLLRIINGIFPPDKGKIQMKGRIGALIAVGAGFHPHMTGKENIYLNGTILGMNRKEIDKKLDEIIDFAEIGDFIDSPVATYSSGMTVRLGFAIAIQSSPDILLIDEILAVGDINFQIKCGNKIRKISPQTAVVFVSHSMQNVSWFCTRVILMKDGKVFKDASNPVDGINTYLSMILTQIETSSSGTGNAHIVNMQLYNGNYIILEKNPTIYQNENIIVELEILVKQNNNGVNINLAILDEAGSGVVYLPLKNEIGLDSLFSQGKSIIRINIGKIELNAGKYSFLLAIKDADSKEVLLRQQGICPFKVFGNPETYAKIIRPVVAYLI